MRSLEVDEVVTNVVGKEGRENEGRKVSWKRELGKEGWKEGY